MTTHTEKVGPDWNLKIRAYLETSQKVTQINGILSASLQVEGKQILKEWKRINVTTAGDGTVVVDIDISVSEVRISY